MATATLAFKDLAFEMLGDYVKITLLGQFYFTLPRKTLQGIADFTVSKHELAFANADNETAARKFNAVLARHIGQLRNRLYNKPTVYIHRHSGIPLIGSGAFGIIDRNTNCIEVKPITGCMLNCIYCSVDEGRDSRKVYDVIVEMEYIAAEAEKLACLKDCDDLEAHIGVQGEPLLYNELVPLIKRLSAVKEIKRISFDTNGLRLTQRLIDELADAGLTRLNISLNAMEPGIAAKIAGAPYALNHVLAMIRYAATRLNVTIAPVWIPTINDSQIEPIIEFAKTVKSPYNLIIGIQNFLYYKQGRNPVQSMHWQVFLEKLKVLEQKHGVKLILSLKEDFGIYPTKPLPKPFKKGSIVQATIVCNGRQKNEMIAASSERTISIPNCTQGIGQKVRLRLIRDKHNIFIGELLY